MATARRMSRPGHEIVSAGALKGDAIVTTQGETLGKLEEIMIDMGEGQVNFAVLVGEGDKLFAIPWASLTLDTQNRRLVTDIERKDFAKVAGFDRDHWPDMSSREWAENLYHLLGRKPYWERVEERWISGP